MAAIPRWTACSVGSVIPNETSQGRRRSYHRSFAADFDDFSPVPTDGDELGVGWFAVFDGLQFVFAGAEAELFGAGAGDDELFAVDEDLNVGVIDLDDEGAVAADDADDGGGEGGEVGRFGEGECGGEEEHNRRGDCPWLQRGARNAER